MTPNSSVFFGRNDPMDCHVFVLRPTCKNRQACKSRQALFCTSDTIISLPRHTTPILLFVSSIDRCPLGASAGTLRVPMGSPPKQNTPWQNDPQQLRFCLQYVIFWILSFEFISLGMPGRNPQRPKNKKCHGFSATV